MSAGAVTKKERAMCWKEKVYELGIVEKGNSAGKYMQIHLAEHDINLDLFMPDDFDYWRQMCIRTGSAEWVAKNVAGGWKKIGWCGSNAGLRLQSQCKGERGPDKKMHWKCIVPKEQQMEPPHWESEEEFFEWLGLSWVGPKNREA